jgi:hypothetical protein
MRAVKLAAAFVLIALSAASLGACSTMGGAGSSAGSLHGFVDDGSRADALSPFGSPGVGPYLLPR